MSASGRRPTRKHHRLSVGDIGQTLRIDRLVHLAETMNFQSRLRVETNCGNCGTTQLRIKDSKGGIQVLLDSRPIFSSRHQSTALNSCPSP
ncbi:MAG: hypothetical protein ACLRMJ_11175 [Alistipes finegoldii]